MKLGLSGGDARTSRRWITGASHLGVLSIERLDT